MYCERCGADTALALDGKCQTCLITALYQLDTLVIDERGQDVWAQELARRYRREMQDPHRW